MEKGCDWDFIYKFKGSFFPSSASNSLVGRRRGSYLFAGYCSLHFTSFGVVIVDKIPPHRLCSQCRWEGVGFSYLCLQPLPVARHVTLFAWCKVGIFTVVSLHCLCSNQTSIGPGVRGVASLMTSACTRVDRV